MTDPVISNAFKTILVRRPEDSRAYRFDVEAVVMSGIASVGLSEERPGKFSRLFAAGRFRENVWYCQFAELYPPT